MYKFNFTEIIEIQKRSKHISSLKYSRMKCSVYKNKIQFAFKIRIIRFLCYEGDDKL